MLTIILTIVACIVLAIGLTYTVFVLTVSTLMVIQSIVGEPTTTEKEKKVISTLAIND